MELVRQINPSKIPLTIALCLQCEKNDDTCISGANICLPLEILRQICAEPSTLRKLEMIDNARYHLDSQE